MKRIVLLILGLVLATASPAGAQIASSLDAGGSPGDLIIRLGNRVVDQLATGPVGGTADDSIRVEDTSLPGGTSGSAEIMRFGSMVGVSGPFVGTDFIRGVLGGGQSWKVSRAEGRLADDGSLRLTVEGLVLADSEVNPATSFRGLVSCLSLDGGLANVLTGEFSADPDGNAEIEDTVAIPSPCLAPVVFVTGPTGNWFAVSGR